MCVSVLTHFSVTFASRILKHSRNCASTLCVLFPAYRQLDSRISPIKFQVTAFPSPWKQRVEVSTIYNYYTGQGNPAQNAINFYAIIDALLGNLLGVGGGGGVGQEAGTESRSLLPNLFPQSKVM